MAGEITFKREELGNGFVYEGEIENGKRFVFGKFSGPGITYIGEFNQNSDMEGMGKLTLETEDGEIVKVGTFKGTSQNGLPLLNGFGVIHYFWNSAKQEEIEKLFGKGGGVKYQEGKFVDDEQHGQGATYHNDGGKYEGEFAHNRMHGKGIITNPDGTTFPIEYNNGKAI